MILYFFTPFSENCPIGVICPPALAICLKNRLTYQTRSTDHFTPPSISSSDRTVSYMYISCPTSFNRPPSPHFLISRNHSPRRCGAILSLRDFTPAASFEEVASCAKDLASSRSPMPAWRKGLGRFAGFSSSLSCLVGGGVELAAGAAAAPCCCCCCCLRRCGGSIALPTCSRLVLAGFGWTLVEVAAAFRLA